MDRSGQRAPGKPRIIVVLFALGPSKLFLDVIGRGLMILKLKSSVSLVALVFASGLATLPADAADVGRRAAPVRQAVAPVAHVYSWQGFYIGGHIGAGEARFGGVYKSIGSRVFADDLNVKGVLGGIHGGYNWDFGAWVVGVEGDYSFSRWRDTVLASDGSSESMTAKIDGVGSIRGRIGSPVGADRRVLPFLTAGVAWADASVAVFDAGRGLAGTNVQNLDYSSAGAVYGGGFEYAVNEAFLVRVEALLYKFNDTKAITLVDRDPGDKVELRDIWTVRVGGSFKF